jgi:WD40 repeat protein
MKLDQPKLDLVLEKTYQSHLASITSVEFHPKKAIIATTSDDKTFKLYRHKTGELLMHFEGHKDWVSGLSFHSEGKFWSKFLGAIIASCGGDATIRLWDILKQECVHVIKDHSQPVWKVRYHITGSFLLSCSMDHTIRLYDTNNNKSRISYRAHVDSVNSINWVHMDPNLFVSGSADKTISLWDMRTNICAQTYFGHKNSVNCAVTNLTGVRLGSCDSDGIVKVWDIRMVKGRYIDYLNLL